MGLAYGAAEEATTSHAKRIGVVIGPDGTVKEYEPQVDARAYPSEVLQRL